MKKKNCNFFLANERTHQINYKLAIRINEKSGVSEVNPVEFGINEDY